MTDRNNPSSTLQNFSRQELRNLVRNQLQALLEQGDLQGAKAILVPVQPADIAEAIEGLTEPMQVLAFRLLSKGEAIEVYEYLDRSVQEALVQEFKRQDVIDIVDKMSPDDRARTTRQNCQSPARTTQPLRTASHRPAIRLRTRDSRADYDP